MKVVILAGGLGTRLGEETGLMPKPMVTVGEKPILWHIMKIYSHYGFNDFVVLCGYKHEIIKQYFVNYYANNTDITVDLKRNSVVEHINRAEDWKVTLLDTGLNTMTGARIRKAQAHLNNETFMLTYGDGVGDINIPELIKTHKTSGKSATLTAVQPSGRFGALDFANDDTIVNFKEKPRGDGSWINGGFFVLEPEVFNYIPEGEDIVLEEEPLKNLVDAQQLQAYKHSGFWRPMDTLKDKLDLNTLWTRNEAPWKIWD